MSERQSTEPSDAADPAGAEDETTAQPVASWGEGAPLQARRASEEDTAPLLLFDGVCNLCNAAVRWVLERDREQKFAFASLQSRAARAALAAHDVQRGDLPDSMVLIDERGVQTRSSAALGVARHLPLPYALLAGAAVVPRWLRDPIYEWVARNRYRWFGKSDLCRLPAPEERARFLDAEEDPMEIAARLEAEKTGAAHGQEGEDPNGRETAESPEQADQSTRSEPPTRSEPTGADSSSPSAALRGDVAGSSLLVRFLLVYVFVYILPFPLSLLGTLYMIPGFGDLPLLPATIGFLVGLHGMVVQPLVLALGEFVFGVTPEIRSTGSGDMTYHYLDAVFDLGLSVVATLVWWLVRRRQAVSPRLLDGWRVLARYYLAMTLLSYGWAKAFPVQFPLPGPDRLMQPYGESSPMGLLWTFMGASPGYQIFGGLMELLGGYLLFFRRTALLGALVTAGVMTNIVALNVFYDVPVKLYSAHLLLIAVLLALPDVARLAGMFLFNLPVQARDLSRRFVRLGPTTKRVLLWSKVAVIVGLTAINVSGSRSRLLGPGGNAAQPHPLRGLYVVERFEVVSESTPAEDSSVRWVRVGLSPPWTGTVLFADGTAMRMRLQVDDDADTLALYDRGQAAPAEEAFVVRQPTPGVLILRGPFGGRELEVELRRLEGDSLLTSRGFRWINEYPFNR